MDRHSLYGILRPALLTTAVLLFVNGPLALAEAGKVTISAPQDNTMVASSFMLKFDLDKGEQGDHVHLYVDGENKGVVRSTSHELSGLAPGRHTIEVRLASKGHAELGPKAAITVTVR